MAEGHVKHHDYHLVDPSPWPIIGAVSAFLTAFGAIVFMRSMDGGDGLFGFQGYGLFAAGLAAVAFTMLFWWWAVVNEAEHKGYHTPVVQLHMRYGMILFIASEVMFFVAWFWAFFDAAFFPDEVWKIPGTDLLAGQVERNEFTGGQWPPKNIKAFDPWELPLINTLILITSSMTVTYAHHSLIGGSRKGMIGGLVITVVLGAIFTVLQAYEYMHAPFGFSDNIYGATFFMATGFHGAHVIIGTIFLFVTLLRALAGHFTPKHHFGFEAAAWYWHFVDVVWLFLFTFVYVILGDGGMAAP